MTSYYRQHRPTGVHPDERTSDEKAAAYRKAEEALAARFTGKVIQSGLLAGNPIHNASHPNEGWIYCAKCCEQAGAARVAEVQARIEALAASR